MAPTLAQSYLVEINVANVTSLVSPSFTPATGELIVVKAANEDAVLTFGTPSASGFTLGTVTSRVNNGTSGATCRTALWTATVTSGGTAGTITLTVGGTSRMHAMVVERWTNAQLAASPVVANTSNDTTSPWQTTITTAAANSVISYVCADYTAVSPASVAFSGDTATPTQEQAITNQTPTNYAAYWLYQAAALAGSNTIGLSAPAGMNLNTAGIEIQDAGGAAPPPKVAWQRRQATARHLRPEGARYGGR
jgi:hypothetical protein